ncbi:hypothetical protein [Gemmatimonas sp.]
MIFIAVVWILGPIVALVGTVCALALFVACACAPGQSGSLLDTSWAGALP